MCVQKGRNAHDQDQLYYQLMLLLYQLFFKTSTNMCNW